MPLVTLSFVLSLCLGLLHFSLKSYAPFDIKLCLSVGWGLLHFSLRSYAPCDSKLCLSVGWGLLHFSLRSYAPCDTKLCSLCRLGTRALMWQVCPAVTAPRPPSPCSMVECQSSCWDCHTMEQPDGYRWRSSREVTSRTWPWLDHQVRESERTKIVQFFDWWLTLECYIKLTYNMYRMH